MLQFIHILLLASISLCASETIQLKSSSVFVPTRLGSLVLLHSEDGFSVLRDGKMHKVQRCFVDPVLRNITTSGLKRFQEAGYIAVSQLDNDEFALRARVRGLGGGPITGAIVYFATKAICYGTAVAAAGGAVVATGGLAGALSGALVTATTVGTTAGTSLVAGTIAGAGLTAEAGALTASVVASAGTIGAAVAVVESASVSAGLFFTAIPFLP